MKVRIPSPLHSYTQSTEVSATGATLAELLTDLDRQFPGLRFRLIDELDRLRPHMQHLRQPGSGARSGASA